MRPLDLQRLQCSFLCARDPEEKMEKIVPKAIRGRQTANSVVCIEKVLTEAWKNLIGLNILKILVIA